MSSCGVAVSTVNDEPKKNLESPETFKFHERFIENSNNGLHFNNIYLPEEVVAMILSNIEPKEILKATLVCKRWCNLIKSTPFWSEMYSTVYKKKPKKLPWYVYYCLFTSDYFNKNLIKNGNGQNKYNHWKIIHKGGDGFAIEDPPCGADPLPLDVPEFNGKTSCFATSYAPCRKLQEISIEKCPLMQLILNIFKPHIYLSEWVAGRFDCGCMYTLSCKLYGDKSEQVHSPNNIEQPPEDEDDAVHPNDDDHLPNNDEDHPNDDDDDDDHHEGDDADDLYEGDDASDEEYNYDDYNYFYEDPDSEKDYLHIQKTETKVEQWAGSKWSKIELVVKNYPTAVRNIVFQHEGRDTKWWAGHFGSKMAGGVLKILFDSIEPST